MHTIATCSCGGHGWGAGAPINTATPAVQALQQCSDPLLSCSVACPPTCKLHGTFPHGLTCSSTAVLVTADVLSIRVAAGHLRAT
jgi:hypothetical protein